MAAYLALFEASRGGTIREKGARVTVMSFATIPHCFPGSASATKVTINKSEGRQGPTTHFCSEVSVAENDSNKAAGSDKRKQSLYFPESMLQEIKDEAARLDRSLSWVVQRAWKMARLEIKKIPSVNDVEDDGEEAAGG